MIMLPQALARGMANALTAATPKMKQLETSFSVAADSSSFLGACCSCAIPILTMLTAHSDPRMKKISNCLKLSPVKKNDRMSVAMGVKLRAMPLNTNEMYLMADDHRRRSH